MYSVTPIRAGHSGQAALGACTVTAGKQGASNFAFGARTEFGCVDGAKLRYRRHVGDSPLTTGDGYLV